MKIWGKIWKDNHLLKDTVVEDCSDDTRTHKIMRALDRMTMEFNLEKPIWMDLNISEFKKHARTRFRQDSFIEEIDFDYFEIMIIEE